MHCPTSSNSSSSAPCSPISFASSSLYAAPSFLYEDASSPPPPPPPTCERPLHQPNMLFCTPPHGSARASTVERLSAAISRNDSNHKRNLLYELSHQVFHSTPPPPPPPPPVTPQQSSHGKQRRVISEQEWEGVVARLYQKKERRDSKVQEAGDSLRAKEQAPCTFTPKLNERSLRMAKFQDDIATRSQERSAKREARLNEERQQLAEMQERELTFHPQTNGSATKSRLKDNPMMRKLELQRQVEAFREQEFMDTHTFTPALNAKSMEMTQHRGVQDVIVAATTTALHCTPPRGTFHPQINSHSRRLAIESSARQGREKLPAFERLYALSVANRKAKLEKENTPLPQQQHLSANKRRPEAQALEFVQLV